VTWAFKIPTWLTKPSDSWTEVCGVRRAVAALRTEAKLLRKEGFDLQPKALMRVAAALSASIRKGEPVSEAETLNWTERAAVYSDDGDGHG
jgi:hypothetical protein